MPLSAQPGGAPSSWHTHVHTHTLGGAHWCGMGQRGAVWCCCGCQHPDACRGHLASVQSVRHCARHTPTVCAVGQLVRRVWSEPRRAAACHCWRGFWPEECVLVGGRLCGPPPPFCAAAVDEEQRARLSVGSLAGSVHCVCRAAWRHRVRCMCVLNVWRKSSGELMSAWEHNKPAPRCLVPTCALVACVHRLAAPSTLSQLNSPRAWHARGQAPQSWREGDDDALAAAAAAAAASAVAAGAGLCMRTCMVCVCVLAARLLIRLRVRF
jgi:hypothetical protein